MGIANLQVLLELKSSVSVQTLYTCIASALGFDSGVSMVEEISLNQTPCTKTGIDLNGSECVNYHPCSSIYTEFGPIFASLSYLVLLISSIQLIIVMVHDSLQDDKHHQSRWRKGFRFTIQKCLLGAVILATGSRAIYYTVQSLIPDKWGDILLNIYYPSLLSAFSLLICFWAEFFYTSSNLEGEDFLKKHNYSITYLAFNVMVYLLLLADIIATPFISDQEQVQLSGIMGSIFAFFLFVTLVGFLHFSIRLFFRPDLFVQLVILRINFRQQCASVLGIVSNALMQSLIISLLVFNMVVHYFPVDSYSLYVCAVVIRVTELILPIWFCCSLWNCKEPKRLWILNPGLILKQGQMVDDVESKPLVPKTPPCSSTQYGTLSSTNAVDVDRKSIDSVEEGHCWICLGNDDLENGDLFYPCNCQLHRKCIEQWVVQRASNVNIPEKEYMRCQVCRKKYRTARKGFSCLSRGMQRSHRLQLLGACGVVLCSVVGLALFGHFAPLDSNKKILTICAVAIFEAVVIKILGVRIALVLRKANNGKLEFKGYTVTEWRKRKERKGVLQKAYWRSSMSSLSPSNTNGGGKRGGADVVVLYSGGGSGGASTGSEGTERGTVEIVSSVHIMDASISIDINTS